MFSTPFRAKILGASLLLLATATSCSQHASGPKCSRDTTEGGDISCTDLEVAMRQRYYPILRSLQSAQMKDPNYSIGDEAALVLAEMDDLDEDIPSQFGAEGQTSDYFKVKIVKSDKDNFVLRVNPVSSRVRGRLFQASRVGGNLLIESCEAEKDGDKPKDPVVIKGQDLVCQED